jgi:hypothetical protein
MSTLKRVSAVVLVGLVLLGAAPRPALAQAGRPTGPTQGQVVGSSYINRPAGYTFQLPPSWISHGYKWYEYWGTGAAQQRPGAAHVAQWVYVPMDRSKPEAGLITIMAYPADVWQSIAAEGGPPVGQVLAQTDRFVYIWSGRQDAPYGDGSPDEQQATALYADVPIILNSFRLLESAGRPVPEPATQVVPFDPMALPLDSSQSQTARTATCVASTAVPRAGAYACQLEGTTDALDPCFVISGTTLACNVNPVTGSYSIVTAAGELPATTNAQPSPVPFYVELGADKPACLKRAQPLPIGGYSATYACQAPGAWLVGAIDTSRPVWIAQYITSDTQNTAVTYGPEPALVTRAWVY